MRFGPFEFDLDSLDLRRDGQDVHLQRQPKQVLGCLVRNAPRTVTRDELRKAVWGDETFVDFERGLNFCISQIRTALGDDAANPQFIRTVARQGYQFIAPLQSRTRAPIAAAAMLVVAAILTGAYALQAHRPSQPIPIVAVVRFDNETGDASLTRFSDGLTDNFVERLTSMSNARYAVIGNAEILRRPRDGRDLKAIASALHARFIILGQVQAYGGQTRILVHLIHMPEQTHVSVARMDRSLEDRLKVEAEAAQAVAAKFSRKLTNS